MASFRPALEFVSAKKHGEQLDVGHSGLVVAVCHKPRYRLRCRVYEARIIGPQWASSPSEFVLRWNAEVARRPEPGRTFLAFVTTLPLTLLSLANLVAAWQAQGGRVTRCGRSRRTHGRSARSGLRRRTETANAASERLIPQGRGAGKPVVEFRLCQTIIGYPQSFHQGVSYEVPLQ